MFSCQWKEQMEREITNFRRERNGSQFRLLIVFFFQLFLLFLQNNAVHAQTPKSTIANPAGTTIDIIDYSLYDIDTCHTSGSVKYKNNNGNINDTGINRDHTLWFHSDTDKHDLQLWNNWSKETGGVAQGIVKPFLKDGFPELNCGGTVRQRGVRGGNVLSEPQVLTCVNGAASESLDYLFKIDLPADYDPDDPEHNFAHYKSEYFVKMTDTVCPDLPYWEAFPGVNYLFTVDQNGYYTFDSQYDRAVMDEDTGKITVYPHPHWDQLKRYGFYPFSHQSGREGERPSSPDGTADKSGWFFGAHIQSDFSIPYDYKVQNPSGEYNDMVFNFRGDDDIWLFIDGILIGDAGGIHSQQDININFKTGTVSIYNSDTRYPEQTHAAEPDTTVYQMVKKAYEYQYGETLTDEEIREKLFEDFEWNDPDDPTTFAGGTYHKLDLFYLERGAGGSNMIMQFNIVSSYDFTAHKSLHRGSSTGESVLSQNQFHYRLTGFPAEYEDSVTGDDRLWEAIMPKKRHDQNVTWQPNYTADKSLIEPEYFTDEPKTLIVGNSQDGFINFGGGDLKGSLAESGSEFAQYYGKVFKYVYEELPPKDAVINCDGSFFWEGQTISPMDGTACSYKFGDKIYDFTQMDPDFEEYHLLPPVGAQYQGTYTYKGSTVSRNAEGKYVFDGITYDNTVYYFTGELTVEECDTGDSGDNCEDLQYWVQRTYYTDYTYEDLAAPGYRNFDNRYNSVGQADLKAGKRLLTTDGIELPTESGMFSFTLTGPNPHDPENPYSDTKTNAGDGSVKFDAIRYTTDDLNDEPETYIMYEIRENPGSWDKIDYSAEKYYARVHLTDDGFGTMSVDVKYYRPCEDGECENSTQGTNACLIDGENCYVEIGEEDVIFTNRENVERTLTVSKTVSGIIGSRNKLFDFTLSMPEMAGRIVRFSRDGGTTFEDATFGEDGKAVFSNDENTFGLRHGDSITFYGIVGDFTVEETTESDYETEYTISSENPDTPDVTEEKKIAEGTVTLEDNAMTVTYTNTLDTTPPTGLRDSLAPALAGIAGAVLMLLTVIPLKKREENG